MLDNSTLAKAIVGAEASKSVGAVMYREPTASEKVVASVIADEVGRIEAKVSLLLSHIEGHYESKVANLELEVARLTPSAARSFLSKLFGRSK